MLNYLWDALRQVVFLLDQVAYGLIPAVYELIFYLSNINLATSDVFVALINRVYLLLGIFMLFKVSFSILQYIVDPNAFSDRSKGFGKLVTNALVSVVLLAAVPFIFSAAYNLQGKIVLSNVIPRLILGDTSYEDYSYLMDDAGNSSSDDDVRQAAKNTHAAVTTMAKDVQFTLFSAFYSLNTINADDAEEAGKESTDIAVVCDPSVTGKANSNVIGSRDMASSNDCLTSLHDQTSNLITSNGVSLASYFKYLDDDGQVVDKRDFGAFRVLLTWHEDGTTSPYRISYFPIVSAIIGLYVLFLLVTFAIDIAVRIFKLMFLQAVAPIAIISYIDPKESASSGKLHSWASECGKTYVSLFLRLAVVFLAMQLISLLTVTVFAPVTNIFEGANYSINDYYYNGIGPASSMNMFVYVFLIIGVFMFARQLPQMIESIFNIKSGDMKLNPFKHDGFNAMLGGIGIGAATLGAGAINTGIGLARTARDADSIRSGIGGTLNAFRSGIGGMASGARRSIAGAARGEKAMKNFRNSFGSAMFARQQREDLNRQGSRWYGRVGSDVARNLGIMNAAQRQQLDYDSAQKALQARQAAVKREKEQRTRAYNDYANAVEKMDSMIKGRTLTAQRNYDAAMNTGNQQEIEKAAKELTQAKTQAFNDLSSSDTNFQAYLNAANDIRANNADTIGQYADFLNDKGEYSVTSMWQAKNDVGRIDFEYANGVERELAEAQEELESRKNTAEWNRNELDNSSRGVTSPQPEGWTPHAGYGASGYMGWGDGNGNGPGD